MKVKVHTINALYSMSSEIQQYLFEEFRPLIVVTNDFAFYNPIKSNSTEFTLLFTSKMVPLDV